MAGMILCVVLSWTAFWAYEEIYFLSSNMTTESKEAIQALQYIAKQKRLNVDALKGPFPHAYCSDNREFVWTSGGEVVATIYFTYLPHDYEIQFSGKLSSYDK